MLDREGHALLMDFGVAKLVDEDHTAYTVVGTTVGTPAFMAPEQARGGEVDRRADIYSLGVIAYSLLTGAMPFKADSQPALLHKIVYEPPIQPEEVNRTLPSGVVYALKKVLAKSPSQRYASAGEFAKALAKGLTWAPSSGEMRAVQERMLVTTGSQEQVAAAPPKRRNGGAVLIGASTLAAVAAALFIFGNPMTWLSGTSATSTDGASIAAPATITLLRFQPADGNYLLAVPGTWTEGNATYDRQTAHTFDAPDRIGRIFAVQLPGRTGETADGAAKQALLDFLAAGDLPYVGIQPVGGPGQHQAGTRQIYEQEASAQWLGRPVSVVVRATAGEKALYMVGMIVEAEQAAVFEPLRRAVFDSLQVDLPMLAQTPAETVLPDATQVSDATPDAESDKPSPAATPMAVGAEAAATALDDALATEQLLLPTTTPAPVDNASGGTAQPARPADVNAPPAGSSDPGDSEAAAGATEPPAALPPVPTETPMPRPTATALPTSTPTNSPTPNLGATKTAEATLIVPLPRATNTATATRTFTPAPTPTRTPTRTPTPNLAATQTAAMAVLNTSVAETLTALAPHSTATGTPTPRATATPLPTATATPTASSTATPTPDWGATQTAEALKWGTALAQTMTAIAPPTATNTATPTRTPRPTATMVPTATQLPTATRIVLPTATNTPTAVPGTPDLAALNATAAAIQTALAELSATPTPTVSELDATATAINEMLTAIAPKAP